MPANGDFERGELYATVRNIDNNVNAVRTEMTSLGARVTQGEQERAAERAQREVRIQEYDKFRADTEEKLDKLGEDVREIGALKQLVSQLTDALTIEADLRRKNDDKVDDLMTFKTEMRTILRSIKFAWGAIIILTGIVITQVWTDVRAETARTEQTR